AHPPITSLRSKEDAHDYRYFPEPDLVPVAIDEEMIQAARAAMPELPAARMERLEAIGLSAESAQLLAFRFELGDYFEAALAAGAEPAPQAQALANWIAGELAGRLGDGEDPASSRVQAGALAALVGLVGAQRVSVGAGRRGRARRGRRERPGGQCRRRRARARGQREGDRSDRRVRDARDEGSRRRDRGGAAGARAARNLSHAVPIAGDRLANPGCARAPRAPPASHPPPTFHPRH